MKTLRKMYRIVERSLYDKYFTAITTRKERDYLSTCPGCGGEADNGFDRCLPPGPYYCTKCDPEPAA